MIKSRSLLRLGLFWPEGALQYQWFLQNNFTLDLILTSRQHFQSQYYLLDFLLILWMVFIIQGQDCRSEFCPGISPIHNITLSGDYMVILRNNGHLDGRPECWQTQCRHSNPLSILPLSANHLEMFHGQSHQIYFWER